MSKKKKLPVAYKPVGFALGWVSGAVASAAFRKTWKLIRHEDDAWWIVDLGSTNGTQVNGRRATRERLREGDVVTLGATEIVFANSGP